VTAHKTLTTTTKRNLNGKKGKLVESIIPKLPIQQLPTWKKVVYFYNNNQTNQKPQSKPETNLKKQLEKVLVHTGQTNNFQKENSEKYTLNFDSIKIQNKTTCYLVTGFHCYSHVYV